MIRHLYEQKSQRLVDVQGGAVQVDRAHQARSAHVFHGHNGGHCRTALTFSLFLIINLVSVNLVLIFKVAVNLPICNCVVPRWKLTDVLSAVSPAT